MASVGPDSQSELISRKRCIGDECIAERWRFGVNPEAASCLRSADVVVCRLTCRFMLPRAVQCRRRSRAPLRECSALYSPGPKCHLLDLGTPGRAAPRAQLRRSPASRTWVSSRCSSLDYPACAGVRLRASTLSETISEQSSAKARQNFCGGFLRGSRRIDNQMSSVNIGPLELFVHVPRAGLVVAVPLSSCNIVYAAFHRGQEGGIMQLL